MKSAYELAMSRLEKESPSARLSDAKRTELAELDTLYQSRIAERRIFLEGEIAKAHNDPSAADDLRRQLASEITRLETEREEKKEKVRRSA